MYPWILLFSFFVFLTMNLLTAYLFLMFTIRSPATNLTWVMGIYLHKYLHVYSLDNHNKLSWLDFCCTEMLNYVPCVQCCNIYVATFDQLPICHIVLTAKNQTTTKSASYESCSSLNESVPSRASSTRNAMTAASMVVKSDLTGQVRLLFIHHSS